VLEKTTLNVMNNYKNFRLPLNCDDNVCNYKNRLNKKREIEWWAAEPMLL
jgi:hypothetical protein